MNGKELSCAGRACLPVSYPRAVSVETMRRSDAYTIAHITPSKELMYRAGKGIFEAGAWKPPVGIVCGKGNNAGDGFVVGLLMKEAGIPCELLLTSDVFSEDGQYYFDRCLDAGVPYSAYDGTEALTRFGSLLDCLFGTGFSGSVRAPYDRVIRRINESGAYVVSADINSGLNGDSGCGELYVRSDLTVSIGTFKYGHFTGCAGQAMKEKVNVDIGIRIINGGEERMTVERWGMFELTLPGKTEGNPFTDYEIRGVFTGAQEEKEVRGFYDGDGIYVIRFMPSFEGEYRYRVSGSFSEEAAEGSFTVTAPSEGNHGPVHVANKFHFAYADGTPYYSIGTTCYVWALQSDERIRETLETLRTSAFNKIRFCIFPKHYDFNLKEPRSYPYEGTPMDSSVLNPDNFMNYGANAEGNHWDFYRFNPAHFRHLEWCVLELQKMGIEADLIVMHPYDRWGFSQMAPDQDDLYWRYMCARFSAFRNVWWAFANEYDLLRAKTEADWERYAQIVQECDPYEHLRSIHNCFAFYDHTRPWITHCSLQRQDIYRTAENTNYWREQFGKPCVLDEIAYEGNIQHGWGNITGEEMLRRFWETAVRGGYPGHGETVLTPEAEGVLWWSHGGKLHGESHKRFRFLYDVLCETPGHGLRINERPGWDEICAVPEDSPADGSPKEYYLYYYSFMRPSFRDFHIDDETEYSVRVLDTWNMTAEDRGVFKGKFRIELPARQYMAVQLRKVK